MPNNTRSQVLSWLSLIFNNFSFKRQEIKNGKTLLEVLEKPTNETSGYEVSLAHKPENSSIGKDQISLTIYAIDFNSMNMNEIVYRLLSVQNVTRVQIHLPEPEDDGKESYNFTAKFLTEDDIGEDRRFLTAELIEKWDVLPLARANNRLYLAAINPHNEMADDIRMATGYDRITIYRISREDYIRFKQFVLPA